MNTPTASTCSSSDQPIWFSTLIETLNGEATTCHAESQGRQFAYRYRVVWQPQQSTASVSRMLNQWQQLLSVCPLVRANDLAGLELGSQTPLTLSEPLPSGVEWFELNQVMPTLAEPGLLLMDMDSTAIEIECIDELAKMAGRGDEVAEVTERAMQGELDFETSLRQRVAALANADETIISRLCEQLPLMPGLQLMVSELQAHGWHVALASGGFTPFVNFLKDKLSLTAAYANQLVIENGKLTGEVEGDIVDANYKAKVLALLSEQLGVANSQCVAIGDGANDIPMVNAASLGVAFHAKAKLKAASDASIDDLDLRVLPFLFEC